MNPKKAALVLAAATALAMGTGSAYAGTGPAPAPAKSGQAAARSAAPSAAGNPASARARAAGVCSDAYQIGSTAYLGSDSAGNSYASLKQFYSPSCHQNYGYVWVWDAYVQTHADPYEIRIGVWDRTTNTVEGQVITENTREQEFWSQGTDTTQDCTRADGYFIAPGETVYTQTGLRC